MTMANRWFRFYDAALDDPKVQTLDGDTFKVWVNLLCLASRNDGRLPAIEHVAFALRCDQTVAERYIERLSNAGLIDRHNGGANGYHYAPHGWKERQYKSDTSTDRVKRYRQRKRETAPETDTETDSSEPKGSGAETPSAIDLKAMVFASGRQILKASGHSDREAGSILGRMRKTHTDAVILDVLARCEAERPEVPLEWIQAALSRTRADGAASRQGSFFNNNRGSERPFYEVVAERQKSGASA